MNRVYDSDDERRRLSRPDPDQLDLDGRPVGEWDRIRATAPDLDAREENRE